MMVIFWGKNVRIVDKFKENAEYLLRIGLAVIQEFLAFLELKKFLVNICSFEQLFYRKKSLGAPDSSLREWDKKGDVRVRNSQRCRATVALEMESSLLAG